MNRPSQVLLNFLTFLLILFFAASVQTSLFHWLIGWRATVQVVIVIITYVCLYRNPPEALLFTVVSFYGLGLLSTMYQSIGVFAGICIFFAIQAIRKQVYSSNPVHFTWTALSAVLFFHIIAWLASFIFASQAPPLRPLDWILEVLLTALFTRILFSFFLWVDQKTKRLTISELNR